MRLSLIFLAPLVLVALPALSHAQTSAADADAIKHGYPNAKAYYCHIYGEAPLRGDTCPPEYLKRTPTVSSSKAPAAPSKGDVCSAAWVECWNTARAEGNTARQAQCTAEQNRCRARMKK